MLLVDPRAGSRDLIEPLKERGLPVEVMQLNSADIAFLGRGVGGAPVWVGIEYKKISEVLDVIRTGRFAEVQLPRLQEDYDTAGLLIEGEWKEGKGGQLLLRKGYREWGESPHGARSWRYLEVREWLQTQRVRGGLDLDFARGRDESVAILHALYAWWTSKDLDEHKAHLRLFDARPNMQRVSNRRLTTQVKVAAQLPGIGWEGAWAAAETFQSVEGMVAAAEFQWSDLLIGSKRKRRLGDKAGREVWWSLRQSHAGH